MVVGIASGKGGTGKTTVATNLAVALEGPVRLLDCDVEAPNAHLFLKPVVTGREEVHMEVPEIDRDACILCGQCQEICQFNAIAVAAETGLALTFPELCHGCGGCFLVCPQGAIASRRRLLGTIERGTRGALEWVQGKLRVGEAMSPPLIHRVCAEANPGAVTIVDAPPGTSCPVITALRDTDFVVLVTEPTPFGLNDLELAVGAVRRMGIPMGIVINRSDLGDDRIHAYARREALPILLEIPFSRAIAETYARGGLLVEALPEWRTRMRALLANIQAHMPPRSP